MGAHHSNLQVTSNGSVDFVDHLDHWLEYLSELLVNADDISKPKLKRQIRCLLGFRAGTNCNINHNRLLQYYYSNRASEGGDDISLRGESYNAEEECARRSARADEQDRVKAFIAEFRDRDGSTSMSIDLTEPIQSTYNSSDPAFKLIRKALVSEDMFFMQGPPGTGKTTAIVEIVLQQIKANPAARILISSETHVAVDNALDRVAAEAAPDLMCSILRYREFRISEFECKSTPQAEAATRAQVLWDKARVAAPELTRHLMNELEPFLQKVDGSRPIARWQARNLSEMHQLIGATCNQLGHLMDNETKMFDLAIVDECSKATLPEWLMAMSVARKCILVGDHKQLPPTFCEDETEILGQFDRQKQRLIRNGVIERLFENLPATMKGSLRKQFRMLRPIGEFISCQFYNGELQHNRTDTDHEFNEFGWLTYKSNGYRVPAQKGTQKKVLVNETEIRIIMSRLVEMNDRLERTNANRKLRKISVALITPYRAQRNALYNALEAHDFNTLAIEASTVDAFQGRQADIVFFSFVRTTGPATFYADERRMNVAISRARDTVYLVGDVDYVASKRLPVLDALVELPILKEHLNADI